MKLRYGAIGIVLVFVAIIGALMCTTTVPAGYVGVADDPFLGHYFWTNKENPTVNPTELQAGFQLKLPTTKIQKFDIKTQKYEMSAKADEGQKNGDDSIQVITKEGLALSLDLSVYYKVMPDQASTIYQSIGTDYEDKIVRQNIRSIIREVAAKYTAMEIYGDDRTAVQMAMHDELERRVATRGILVEEVLLKDVKLPTELVNAINAKKVAEQEAEKMEYVLAKEVANKQQKIIQAEAEQEAMIIKAQGEAEAIKLVNDQLAQSGQQYIELQYVKALAEQDFTVMVPQGTTPFVDMRTD